MQRHLSRNDYRIKLGVVFSLNGILRGDINQSAAVANALAPDDFDLLIDAATDIDRTINAQATELLFRLQDKRVAEPAIRKLQ